MHVDTEMSYHGADPPGAPIFEGCIGGRPGREAASLVMLWRRKSYEGPGRQEEHLGRQGEKLVKLVPDSSRD
jgi:hypothetical protein